MASAAHHAEGMLPLLRRRGHLRSAKRIQLVKYPVPVVNTRVWHKALYQELQPWSPTARLRGFLWRARRPAARGSSRWSRAPSSCSSTAATPCGDVCVCVLRDWRTDQERGRYNIEPDAQEDLLGRGDFLESVLFIHGERVRDTQGSLNRVVSRIARSTLNGEMVCCGPCEGGMISTGA